ncbi:hypothetical protein CAY60_002520 [Shouchella clausii]|uniref:hypothetical protein n=1 Tax=Shouchella clausii TaxID=79880 RepID=UPI00273F0E10|nr:hypothetical protein [Shouchella clausii]MDP5256351.1 hypothetical protein [Shouchella clausii]MDP5264176.1 hypothetical protein [Shouchella clausii]MDP5281952.1 hypothetical protein [Shouchella clausii]MDP5301829.1 hypothetical protein [Shouchella clausii]
MENGQKNQEMTILNKIQAFILMPGYMMVVSFVLYYLLTFSFIKAEGIIAIISFPLFFSWIYVPLFREYQFKEMYYKDGDMPIKVKIQKNKQLMLEYSSAAAVFTTGFALIFHI